MPRKRRRRPETSPSPPQSSDWRWWTFPVFFAFVVGLLLGILVAFSPLAFIIFYVSLFAVVFGAVHLITRRIVRWRQQAQGRELPGRGIPSGKRPS